MAEKNVMEFTCPNCSNHCHATFELQQGAIVNMQGCPCPKGMMTLLQELLPMNQTPKEHNAEKRPS